MVKVINTLLVQAERDINAFFSYNQRGHLIHTPFNLLLHSFRVSSSTKHKQTQPKAKPEVNGRHSIMLLPCATSRAVITHAVKPAPLDLSLNCVARGGGAGEGVT